MQLEILNAIVVLMDVKKFKRLILQCYDLCPSYASEATIQKSQVLGICAAVPSSATSSLPIASATMSNVAAVASNTPASSNPASTSASASASSSVNNKNSSSAAHIYPTYALLMICAIIGLLQL
ncbi:hypothetical protein G6F56_012355 [Rhizopus delemar]|nr:hypothetical protein G6F56_012355 [Rhizopus delemar]